MYRSPCKKGKKKEFKCIVLPVKKVSGLDTSDRHLDRKSSLSTLIILIGSGEIVLEKKLERARGLIGLQIWRKVIGRRIFLYDLRWAVMNIK